MSVRVLYFAGLREALGIGFEAIELPPQVNTLATLREHLSARGGAWSALDTTRNLRMACNQAMCAPETRLADGDEVAFFPPVTGG